MYFLLCKTDVSFSEKSKNFGENHYLTFFNFKAQALGYYDVFFLKKVE